MLFDLIDSCKTLMLRDIRSRYSGDKYGFLWSFFSPLAWIVGVYLFFKMMGRLPPIYTDLVSFVLSGMLPYAVFRYTFNSVIKCESVYRSLGVFNHLTRLSFVVSSSLVEFLIYSVLFVFFHAVSVIFFSAHLFNDYLYVFFGFFLSWLIGVFLGVLFLSFGDFSKTAFKLAPIVIRPVFWLSGIFYIASEIPLGLDKFLKYNPLFNSIEIVREGMFDGYHSSISSWYYVFLFCFFLLFGSYLIFLFNKSLKGNYDSVN